MIFPRHWAPLLISCFLCGINLGASPEDRDPPEPSVLTLAEAAQLLRLDADELERLAESDEVPARRAGTEWRFSRAALMEWLSGEPSADSCASASNSPQCPTSLSVDDLSRVTGAGPSPQAQNQAQNDETTPIADDSGENQEETIGEEPQERTAEDVFLRGQRVLLGRGQAVLDFGQFYTGLNTQQLVTVDGGIGLATLEQDLGTTLVLGRVGIMEELEIFGGTALLHQNSDVFLGNTRLGGNGGTRLADVSVGLRHTIVREGSGRPDIIASFDGRIPTGNNAYAIGGTLTMVKSVDPVVLFANVGYHYTFSRTLPGERRLGSSNLYDIALGYGLALNDTIAISTAVSGQLGNTGSFNNAAFRQPSRYNIRFALTSWLARGLYIEPSVSYGLSGPGNAFAFGLTLPYAF